MSNYELNNMYKWTITLGMSLLLALLGCAEQPLPVSQEGEAEFFARGQLDGQRLELVAGEEQYFMATDFSYQAPGLYVLQGTLGPKDCPDCPGSLTIRLRDHRLRPEGSAFSIDTALARSAFAYYQEGGVAEDGVTRVSFENESEGGEYRWTFGDGSTHVGRNPVHDYIDSTLLTPTVCLEATDSTGCTTTICNDILLEETDCAVDFTHELLPGSSYVTFRAEVRGTPPFRYRWNFGDGFGASLGNPGYFYAQPGLYTVCLTVTDGTGCQRTICKNIAADPSFCEHNYSYEVQRTAVVDTLQFSRVEVEWIDEAGEVFRSSLGPQSSQAFCQLRGQTVYQPNEQGQATRQLQLRLNCDLYSEQGERLPLRLDEATLGLAHP